MTGIAARPLPSFTELRQLAARSPMAHACIELRTQQVAWCDWDITGERRTEVVRWFHRPDADYAGMHDWLRAAMRDVLTADSLAIYLRPAQKPGHGLLGSDLAALELLDGSLLAPVGEHGQLASVVQFTGRVRRAGTGVFMEGQAAERMAESPGAQPMGAYGSDGRGHVLLRPMRRRPWTPFGFSPLEEAIRYGEDGLIDMAATEAAIPEAFGFRFTAPAGFEEIPQPSVAPGGRPCTFDQNLRTWMKGIFDEVLHLCGATDLEWAWIKEDHDA